MRSLLLSALLLFTLPLRVAAGPPLYDGRTAVASIEKSILLPAPPADQVRLSFQDARSLGERWAIMRHGIRAAALDPLVWGIRRSERTHNRQLVPIRPMYLRASERPDFRLKEISFVFRFKPVQDREMRKNPFQKDPVLDIGFAGIYNPGSRFKSAIHDRSYIARVSAFPPVESGIWYRSHSRQLLQEKARFAHVETGRNYQLKLTVTSSRADLYLDGEPFQSIKGVNLDRGLVSIMSSWHPVRLSSLEINGTVEEAGKQRTVVASGLIGAPKKGRAQIAQGEKKKRRKRSEPAQEEKKLELG